MTDTTIQESFKILEAVCRDGQLDPVVAYRQLRFLLERLCRELTADNSLQMTDLGARIKFVADAVGLTAKEEYRLHTFRLLSNDVLNNRQIPSRENLLRDVKTLAFFLRNCFQADIPASLSVLLPSSDATFLSRPRQVDFIVRMRVCYHSKDEEYLYVSADDRADSELLKVRYGVEKVNQKFDATCQILWPYAQLNLLDVSVDKDGILTPSFIVLEPDYLIDISSLAECFRDYGHHPANYLLSRLQPSENTAPILLGNIANLFLDEWIHAEGSLDYITCMQKAFRKYPIELASCPELKDPVKERKFFEDCRMHFEHIHATVEETLQSAGYGMDKHDAVLEPSYICEALGLQGRLDYMQRDMSSFIEMKSGKADEYSVARKVVPKLNNRVQMLLYQAVLQYSMKQEHTHVHAYLLYTRYPLLYPAPSSWTMVRRAIDLRNRIVANEFQVQKNKSLDFTASLLAQINPETLNEQQLSGTLWNNYLKPSIARVGASLEHLSELERSYFYALYNFITRELYTAKSGDVDYEGRTGMSALWLSTLTEKLEAGELLYNLRILENHAADEHKASILFSRPEDTQEGILSLPNFREGDAVILYERNVEQDNVTNKLIFKGNIDHLDDSTVLVRLRATQQNQAVLPADSLYAIEHDTTMESTFRSMYQGLAAFARGQEERRQLLLGMREPLFNAAYDDRIRGAADDFERVALKSLAAEDYFLLVGPPGTGKTSRALKRMVELHLQETDADILLLSYTNRAVDEICKSISKIAPEVDYIRMGSELSCDECYREHLVENQLAGCMRRKEVLERIERCRIFVSTVASLSGKQEIFRLKNFGVAIIDESSQILEAQLLGILCARCPSGVNAVKKFVMIGDHKQLPAVVLQSENDSEVSDTGLRELGFTNLRNSLFERLYRHVRQSQPDSLCPSDVQSRAWDMLCRQGRMHPEVASFANRSFYGNHLVPVGLPHQLEEIPVSRFVFIPSVAEPMGCPAKINHSEAEITARICKEVFEEFGEAFDVSSSLGIITPYRSQIALIKQEIARLGNPLLNRILVDTVERFQGSERDVIVYSFCVNYPYQLNFLSNLTEDNHVLVDRKLNVALTRARKKLYITGVPEILHLNPIYKQLI